MALQGGGNGSHVIGTFPSGFLLPIEEESGYFVTLCYYYNGSTPLVAQMLCSVRTNDDTNISGPAMEFRATQADPDGGGGPLPGASVHRVDYKYYDSNPTAVIDDGVPSADGVGGMTWMVVSYFIQKSGSNFEVTVYQNDRNPDTDSGAASDALHEVLTRIMFGRSDSASQWGTASNIVNAGFATGISKEQAAFVHGQIYNGGSFAAIKNTVAATLLQEWWPLDRVGSGENIVNGDAELTGRKGIITLVRAAGTNDAKWSSIAAPYSTTTLPVIYDDPDFIVNSLATGAQEVLFPGVLLYHDDNPTDLELTITIADPDVLSLSQQAIDNGDFTDEGGGVYTAVSTYSDLQSRLNSLALDGDSAGTTEVMVTLSDGVNSDAITREFDIVDPDPTVALSDNTIDFGEVAVGATVTKRFVVRNNGGANQSIDLATTGVTGTGFTLTTDPGEETLDVGTPPSTEDYVFGRVSFTPTGTGEFNGTLTLTTDDSTYEDAANDPLEIALTGTGAALDTGITTGCIDVTPQTPTQTGAIGVDWISPASADEDDNDFAQATILALSGNYTTKKIARLFGLQASFDDAVEIASFDATIKAFYSGDATPSLIAAEFYCPATGYRSGNVISSTAITESEAEYTASLADAETKPTGADVAQGIQVEWYFGIASDALTEGQDTNIYVDYIGGSSQICAVSTLFGLRSLRGLRGLRGLR